jgi:hypothetical protein
MGIAEFSPQARLAPITSNRRRLMPEAKANCPLCGHVVTGTSHDDVAIELMEHAGKAHGVKISKADADQIVHAYFANQHASPAG